MKLITTDAENAVWNCVAKQPPEEKPLTEMVLGLMWRLSRLSWHSAKEQSVKTKNTRVILLLLLSHTTVQSINTLNISNEKVKRYLKDTRLYRDDIKYHV